MPTLNPFPLNIVPKVNSPLLIAWITQFGEDKFASAEDFNKIFQALDYLFENIGTGGVPQDLQQTLDLGAIADKSIIIRNDTLNKFVAVAKGSKDLGLFADRLSHSSNGESSTQLVFAPTLTGAEILVRNLSGIVALLSDINNYYKGTYTTEAALNSAHPTAIAGSYAIVDGGIGIDPIQYIWDSDDSVWVVGSSSSATTTDALPEGTANLYFTEARAVVALTSSLSNKVDKVTDKSLISDTEIIRLASLFNNSNISTIEAFGDSITVGQGATNTNFAYINLVAQFIGKALTNRALSASGVWAASRSHIQNINPNHSVMAFVMSGFNDVRRGGSNPLTRLKIMNSYRSILANHFLKNFVSGGATDTRIVRANGTWFLTYTGLALGLKSNTGAFSSTNGATIEYTFSGNNVVLGMVAVKQSFENHATFTIHIDNTLIGTYNNNDQTDGISDGVYDNNRTQRVLIFDNLSEEMHTIKLTNISPNNFLVIDYFGQLKNPKQSLPICIAKMPKMNSTGYAIAPNLANDSLIDSLNTDIVSVCNEFINKGYPVYIAETNDYYNVNTGLSGDNIHPNNIGYTQIYNAIVAQIGNLIV